MINFSIIEDEKPVVRFFEGFECNVVVLFLVRLVVELQLLVDSVGIDHHFDIRNFGEERQRRLVDVVIDQRY